MTEDVNRLITRVNELSEEFAQCYIATAHTDTTGLVNKYIVYLECQDLYIYRGERVRHTHTKK